MEKLITLIVACDLKGCIGKKGQIPWRLAADMEIFRKLTIGQSVIMGRKTYNSLPPQFRPLPERQNIVITRESSLNYGNQVTVVNSWNQALESTTNKYVFVIGGADIFRLALPQASRIIKTSVQTIIANGDTFIPEMVALTTPWHKTASLSHPKDVKNEHDFNLEVWDREDHPPPETFYLNSARHLDQLVKMLIISSKGICSFCPQYLPRFHTGGIVTQNTNWQVVNNGWPYKGTSIHLLVIPKRHLTDLTQISQIEWLDLGSIIKKLVTDHSLTGYSLFCRSGNMKQTGATVAHLHFHLLSGQNEDGEGQPIKVKLGFG